jgi:hypothetical protein
VVDTAGRTLAQFRQYTGTVNIRTDPRATCFGQGTGGSGNRVAVRGATALGAVRDALESDPALRPLSVTDSFLDQGFGLGVCGIGDGVSRGSSFWYLKRNHVASQVSGSQLAVHQGDDVLWYLAPSFPPPRELYLRAPASAEPNVPFRVTVYSYADNGTRRPAAGAEVTDAAAPTDTSGHAMVTGASGIDSLQASHGRAIPSNLVTVCVQRDPSRCPAAHGKWILGSSRRDYIVGTPGSDSIQARGGRDVVDIRSGGRDRVGCGGGRDRVIVRRGDRNDHIRASCERVVRR